MDEVRSPRGSGAAAPVQGPLMDIEIRAMGREDYAQVFALWQRSPGVGLNESDVEEQIAAFLARNPGMSCVAAASGAIVGAVLCGHDGRRGSLHHLAVDATQRRRGVAARLIERCFERLAEHSIQKCNIFVYHDAEDAAAFWHHFGFSPRNDFRVLQRKIPPLGA